MFQLLAAASFLRTCPPKPRPKRTANLFRKKRVRSRCAFSLRAAAAALPPARRTQTKRLLRVFMRRTLCSLFHVKGNLLRMLPSARLWFFFAYGHATRSFASGPPRFLEFGSRAKNHAFLGPCGELGHCPWWPGRHVQAARNDFDKYDWRAVYLQVALMAPRCACWI